MVVVTDNARATWLFELNNRLKKINKTLEVISGNIWDDYMILINAKYIVMDMSTFTWTAHLASPRTQNVFMWPLFFTRFLAKYRQYVDIMLFNEADMMKKENYCYYNLLRYPECGEWYATKPHLDLLNTWESNNLRILNSNVLEGWFKDRDSLSDDDKNDNFELPDTNIVKDVHKLQEETNVKVNNNHDDEEDPQNTLPKMLKIGEMTPQPSRNPEYDNESIITGITNV